MAGINTLQELYEKRGEEWTRNFLSAELRITEKTNAYRFSFELSRTGRLRFYTKNAETPINRIDRTVSDLYEGAIARIEKLPETLLSNLPKNHRFGFDWAPATSRQPDELSLTDITIRQGGKTVRQIHEKEALAKWANLLRASSGEAVHIGKLSTVIVDSLIESIQNGTQLLLESAAPSKTYIIKCEDQIVKIAPPQYKPRVAPTKSHTFDLLLLQIYEHLQNLSLEKFSFKSVRPDEKYIEIVSEAFNCFVKERGLEFLNLGLQKPGFLERSGKFNPKWIKNVETLKLLESHKEYEYLLSIFLINLRKPKKAVGLLSESFVHNFNQKISEIDDIVRHTEDYGFPEFSSILEAGAPARTESRVSTDDQMKSIGMLQTYFAHSFQNTNKDEAELKDCNVLITNLGQFTRKVLADCERLCALTGQRFVLLHDECAGNACLWGLDTEIGAIAARQVARDFPKVFVSTGSIAYPSVQKIQASAKDMKVTKVYSGRSVTAMQKEYESFVTLVGGYIGEMSFSRIAEPGEAKIADCVEKEDYAKFKEIFPDSVQPFWHNMVSSWKKNAYV